MNRTLLGFILAVMIFISCKDKTKLKYEITGDQSRIIAEMIESVNEKNPEKYVAGFADSVQVFVEAEMKVNGKEALKANRENHFKSNPDVRSEIQHLVEIDNKVILHDKVWLNETDKVGQDVVEIFTFSNGKVIRVDVIQPKNPFSKNR
jgi:hypothetical protein